VLRHKLVIAFLVFLFAALPSHSQQQRSKWQVGTIMAVAEHPSDDKDPNVKKYDVSLKVGKTMYVVLFVPLDGTDNITHRTGLDLLVSVGTKTISFNNLLGHKLEAPILSRKPVTPTS